jgi:quinol-cytochrome oxidoreductase complex cytochrome b subunit
MEQEQSQQTSLVGFGNRVKQAFFPAQEADDDRGRMRTVLNSLILHLHPTKVVKRSLSLTYTWGLGGLSALLVVILAFTGILLTKYYTPSPDQAYYDIINLQSNVVFGELIRNLHHWSANLMIITTVLHLLRVFFTGAYRLPRAFNWVLGIIMLVLVLGANFTGYLLPWDQLAFWAITVATSVVSYIPVIGPEISRMLLGGPEVGTATLLNFYSLHIGVIPIAMVILMSFHFWRVRKDGGITVARKVNENMIEKPEKLTTLPHLVNKEVAFGLVWIAILLAFSMLVPAPLEEIANPMISPNPAKAAWYFLGLQELILHFHPIFGAVLIPGTALVLLIFLPFYDFSTQNEGIYFRSTRGRWLTGIGVLLSLILTPLWIVLDEYFLNWSNWLPDWPSIITTGVIPVALILLGIVILSEVIHWIFEINTEERVMFLVTFFFTALIVLTLTGIFFRGPGMALYLPWNMPVVTGH